MKIKLQINLMIAAAMVLTAAFVFSCAPGNAPAGIPGNPPPQDSGQQGGDPREPVYYAPSAVGQLLDGQQFDSILVGSAFNSEFVYVLSKEAVYAFSKTTNFQNLTGVPNAPAKDISVLPENSYADMPLNYSKHVAVAHSPGEGGGDETGCVIALYGPNLDPISTRLDDGQPGFRKWLAFPAYFAVENIIPNLTQPPDPGDSWDIVDVVGLDLTRNGSILAKVQMAWLDDSEGLKGDDGIADEVAIFDISNDEQPLRLFFVDAWDDPHGERHPTNVLVPYFDNATIFAPPDDDDDIQDYGPYHDGQNYAIGFGTSPAIGKDLDPLNSNPADYFVNESITVLDFVGVSTFSDEKLPSIEFPNYDWDYTYSTRSSAVGERATIDDYRAIIGQSYGSGPGSFAPNPPIVPAGLPGEGDLEDPDVDAGGPAGMFWDPVLRRLYVCDPGNRRVQIFQRNDNDGSYAYWGQIGSGARGLTGNALVAPKSVEVDRDGTVYICDVDRIRIFNRETPQIGFGSLAGTVRKMPGGFALPDATITVSGSQGFVAQVSTDINGQYRIPNLATGRYFVTASHQFGNLEDDSATITILYDQASVANFNLWDRGIIQAVNGNLAGTVYDDATGKPIEDATIRLIDQTGTEYNRTFTTNSVGTFSIPDLAAGFWDDNQVWHPTTWQIVVSKEFYNTTTTFVELLPRSTVNIEVRLKPLLG